jgi:hypothetical protein
MKNLSFIWEIPLAIGSFIFYKVIKFLIGNIFVLYLALNKQKASQWRVLSGNLVKSPLNMAVLMTKGPRWNTHAIIGTLGPFSVEKELSIDSKTANNYAKSWIAVVYSFPSYETITSLESVDAQEDWKSIQLKPGKYTLGLRYYQSSEPSALPAVKIDDRLFVETENIPSNINNFYSDLIKKKNWFYSALHYYIYTLLRLRKYLPESFVKGEYLPVGAPDTDFLYGYLAKNQSLQIETSAEILANYDVYVTLYDRSSLPLSWFHQTNQQEKTIQMPNNGYYLLRLREIEKKSAKVLSFKSELEEIDDFTQRLRINLANNE